MLTVNMLGRSLTASGILPLHWEPLPLQSYCGNPGHLVPSYRNVTTGTIVFLSCNMDDWDLIKG